MHDFYEKMKKAMDNYDKDHEGAMRRAEQIMEEERYRAARNSVLLCDEEFYE